MFLYSYSYSYISILFRYFILWFHFSFYIVFYGIVLFCDMLYYVYIVILFFILM